MKSLSGYKARTSEIAFPVLEPEFFVGKTPKFALSKNDLEAIGLKNQERLRAFAVITIPEDPRQMTANLKASNRYSYSITSG